MPDWSNPQSLNRYAYAKNNPLKYIDPNGHAPILPTETEIQNQIEDELGISAAKRAGVRTALICASLGAGYVGIGGTPRGFGAEFRSGGGLRGLVQAIKSIFKGGPSKAGGVSAEAEGAAVASESTGGKFYRYVGEGEANVIRRTGEIPNVDRAGNPKDVYFTNRSYKTAGRAQTHNQLPNKPTYGVEIEPENVPNRTPFTKVKSTDNPQWGKGGGVEATTRDAIPVDPDKLRRLKGAGG